MKREEKLPGEQALKGRAKGTKEGALEGALEEPGKDMGKDTRKELGKRRGNAGFSMLEVLVVVGIMAILSGIAFINVVQYQRSLEQLERDSVAKEIFVAAQNHLAMAFGAGYYGLGDVKYYGTQDENETDQEDGIYYIVYDHGVSGDPKEMYDLMLPFGSIDEVVRKGGSYLIRYQPEMGLVLDVFYASTDSRFGAKVGDTPFGYTALMDGYTGEENKPKRIHPEGDSNAILGWYGGAQAEGLATVTLKEPRLELRNAERLVARVTDDKNGDLKHVLKLLVTGQMSGAQQEFELTNTAANIEKVSTGVYQVVLDDITKENMHFCQLFPNFYPGEDLLVQAVVYSEGALSNIPYSEEKIENSLYAAIQDTNNDAKFDQALIANFRHLENLDRSISGMDPDEIKWGDCLSLTNALQVANLFWGKSGSIFKPTSASSSVIRTSIYSKESSESESWAGYYPVNPHYALVYDGDCHSITGVTVETDFLYGGLFGDGSKISQIKNLELIDFSVKAAKTGDEAPYAGVLAGKLLNAEVTNVLAYNSKTRDRATARLEKSMESQSLWGPFLSPEGGYFRKAPGLLLAYVPADFSGRILLASATGGTSGGDSDPLLFSCANPNVACTAGAAGGLIGDGGSSAIEDCAAAVFVKGATAGGLLGTGAGLVSECFSGGHTKHGGYEKDNINVLGTEVAGGLVGIYSGTEVASSYSTCSVKAEADTSGIAGGFVGKLESGKITNCYCTGLVVGAIEYAFVGAGTATTAEGGEKNHYYAIVNEDLEEDDPYMPAQKTGEDVVDMDEDAATLNAFLGNTRKAANAYDESLTRYYGGKYGMKTVEQLTGENWDTVSDGEKKAYFVRTHYGDWPSPELFFFNDKDSS